MEFLSFIIVIKLLAQSNIIYSFDRDICNFFEKNEKFIWKQPKTVVKKRKQIKIK